MQKNTFLAFISVLSEEVTSSFVNHSFFFHCRVRITFIFESHSWKKNSLHPQSLVWKLIGGLRAKIYWIRKVKSNLASRPRETASFSPVFYRGILAFVHWWTGQARKGIISTWGVELGNYPRCYLSGFGARFIRARFSFRFTQIWWCEAFFTDPILDKTISILEDDSPLIETGLKSVEPCLGENEACHLEFNPLDEAWKFVSHLS